MKDIYIGIKMVIASLEKYTPISWSSKHSYNTYNSRDSDDLINYYYYNSI